MEKSKKYRDGDDELYYAPFTTKNVEIAEKVIKKGGKISLIMKRDKFTVFTNKKIGGSSEESKLTIPYKYFHYKFLYLKNKMKDISEKESEKSDLESEIQTPKNSVFVDGLNSIYDKISNTFSGLLKKEPESEQAPEQEQEPEVEEEEPEQAPEQAPEPSEINEQEPEVEEDLKPSKINEHEPLLKVSVKEMEEIKKTDKKEKLRGTEMYKERRLKEICEK